MPRDILPPARALSGCLIIVGALAFPIASAVATPGPWWRQTIVALLVGVVTVTFASLILPPVVLMMDRAEPTIPAPRPGPDDPVHYIDYDQRDDGCTETRLHEPHYFYWRSEMPYWDTDGEPVTAPVYGSVWCRGVR